MGSAAPYTKLLEENVPAVAAAASNDEVIGRAPFAGVVTGVSYVPKANITGAASPASRTLSVVNAGQDGNGTTVIATLALVGGVNPADLDERALTLSATAADLNIAAGDVIVFRSAAVGGTGLADPGGRVIVNASRVAGS